ncbi:MAG: hypothetical protein C0508_14605 [Cyanobacteria bacterium PR.023]|nr:hypothetical protein [Cyanobacteria bacterium PR.023]
MPIQLDKFDDDDRPYSLLAQLKRPEYADDKLAREIYVVGAGTANAVAAIKDRLPEVGLQVAGSAAVGFALRAAEAKYPWLSPGLAIGGLALTATAARDLVKPAGQIASTLADTWRSSDNLEANREKFGETGGKFVVDLALTAGAGFAGSALANRSLFSVDSKLSNYVRINTYEPNTYEANIRSAFKAPWSLKAKLHHRQEAEGVSFLSARESSVFLTATKVPGRPHNFSANGFFASEDGLIVTNHHVTAGKIEINAIDAKGIVRKAKVVAENRRDDLAVIKVDPPEPGFKPVKFAQEAAQPGDLVIPVSRQFGVKGLTIGPGKIESIEQMPIRLSPLGSGVKATDPVSFNFRDHSFKFSRELEPGATEVFSERFFGNYFSKRGASGSPLLNGKGEVVAVLSGGYDGKNYAIPAKSIAEILTEARKNLANK